MRFFLHYHLLTLSLLSPLSAYAALGGNADSTATSTNNPFVARKQQSTTTPSNGYSIHQSVSESGITIREYASQQGIVFAVTWDGPSLPDLQQLLGNYFPQFHDAMIERRRRGIRGPVMLQQDNLVVESRGHLRTFRGRAYAPNLLPPQVSTEEIQ